MKKYDQSNNISNVEKLIQKDIIQPKKQYGISNKYPGFFGHYA